MTSLKSTDLKIKPFAALNFVAAYRKHGQRYAAYVLAKGVFLVSNFALSLASFVASIPEFGAYYASHDAAMMMIKIALLLMPYLAFESLYWWYRGRRERLAIEAH